MERIDELANMRAVRTAQREAVSERQVPGLPDLGIAAGQSPNRLVPPKDLFDIAHELNVRVKDLECKLLAKDVVMKAHSDVCDRVLEDWGDWRKVAMRLLSLTPSHTEGWRNFGEILSSAISAYDEMKKNEVQL